MHRPVRVRSADRARLRLALATRESCCLLENAERLLLDVAAFPRLALVERCGNHGEDALPLPRPPGDPLSRDVTRPATPRSRWRRDLFRGRQHLLRALRGGPPRRRDRPAQAVDQTNDRPRLVRARQGDHLPRGATEPGGVVHPSQKQPKLMRAGDEALQLLQLSGSLVRGTGKPDHRHHESVRRATLSARLAGSRELAWITRRCSALSPPPPPARTTPRPAAAPQTAVQVWPRHRRTARVAAGRTRGGRQREFRVRPRPQQRNQRIPLDDQQPPRQFGIPYVVHVSRSHDVHARGVRAAPRGR